MSSLTQKWLRQVVQPYAHSDRVYPDVDAALAHFPSLRPKSDLYTFDDGRSLLLLCIHGLLPIIYRHASYNIPVNIWIPREYPKQPPIAYVVPTTDMLVKAGPFLDVSGRCRLEYLQHWERKHEGCSLIALLEAMQDQFSRESPVYAKPKGFVAATSVQNTDIYPSNPPPLPARPGVSSDSTHFYSNPTPPLPITSPIVSPQRSTFQQAPSQHPVQQQPHSSPPPLPPHPQFGTSPYSVAREIPSFTSALNNVQLTYSHTTPNFAPPSHSFLAPQIPSGHSAPPPPPPPPQFQPVGPQPDQIRQLPAPIPNLLDEDADTVDAFHSQAPHLPTSPSAPPRPLNPELLQLHLQVHQKLTSEFNSLSQALALDAERLRAHQNDLLAGEPAIRDEMARLEAVRDVCKSVADRTRGAVLQAETNITELRRKGDPEIDELVCATTIVHNQLINLIADDNAIEDTVYHLHRALNTGRIDLERFLRTTRVLAEEQFMKRALIDKIQAGVSMMSPAIRPEWA